MGHQNGFRVPVFLPLVLAAVLALPAWAAPSGKTGHYPGQKCDKCHQVPGKPGEKAPASPSSGSGAAAGSGNTGSQSGVMPSQGGSRTR